MHEKSKELFDDFAVLLALIAVFACFRCATHALVPVRMMIKIGKAVKTAQQKQTTGR